MEFADKNTGEKIKVLPPRVSELISAGEVIDRPSSVVKELVENSIDAGADEIVIHVKGKDYIAVFDNGEGMTEKDVLLCFRKHATSKISTEKDLESITTFGFRGEALHSISLVSRLTIRTKPKSPTDKQSLNDQQTELGTEIHVEGGNLKEVKKVYIEPGTQVIVKDLFYNTPARKKFLSSERVEFSYTIDVISRFALAFPSLSIRLVKDGVPYLSLGKERGLEQTIDILFGRKPSEEPKIEVMFSVGDVEIEGFIWRRKVGVGRWIFVNRRYVKDKTVMGAISKFDFLKNSDYILFVNTPPEFYDVNVNPTKTEIRWRTPAKIREILITAVEDGLRHTFRNMQPQRFEKEEVSKGEEIEKKQQKGERTWSRDNTQVGKSQIEKAQKSERTLEKGLSDTYLLAHQPKVLAVLHGIFALVEWQEELYIVDIHAYHEGKLLAELKDKFGSLQKSEKLKFAIPFEFEVSSSSAEKIKDKAEDFHKIGINFEVDGNKIKVFSIPYFLSGFDLSEFFEEFEDGISERKLMEFLGEVACRRAIRKGDRINTWEITEILEGFDPSQRCAHGRPAVIKISQDELERKFGRC